LQTNHPCSVRAATLMFGSPWHMAAWGELPHSLQTGKCAFEKATGESPWKWFEKHPEEAKTFNDAMTSFSAMEAPEIVGAYDFSGFKTVIDVAGGVGGLLISILKANPKTKGMLFDLPYVTEPARKNFTQAGLAGRCEIVTGDFFKEIPAGGDCYVMKSIIHDWHDEACLTILKNIRKGITKDGKLLLGERVIPTGNTPHFGKLLDIEMLAMTTGGKERTEAEYRKLFEQAGFKLTRIVPTRTPMSVIEAVPA